MISCTRIWNSSKFKNGGSAMLRRILIQPEWNTLVRSAALVLFFAASLAPAFAQQPGQRTFSSPEQAGYAFFAASQSDNDQLMVKILGPAGADLISSGDPEEDMGARAGFVVKFQEMHRFVTEPDGSVTLVVGAENWPLPIPLVNKNGSWYFDTDSGKDEILFRRTGRNELAAMDACSDLVEAEKHYFAHAPDDSSREFARRLVSDTGRHDGLYSDGADNQHDSPIDPLIAYAYRKDSRNQDARQIPFNGYFFRVLTSQGPHAPGGARNYIVHGKMTAGFAIVAYPAEYRSSGVMTFIVDESGTIYEKDLGPNSTQIAEAMKAYEPDPTWNKVD
jgi:hypothetical protein